jgi:hypothetical protein
MSNLIFIKNIGIEKFMAQQKVRMKLLKTMIEKYDDGRSKAYFCRATALLDLKSLQYSMDKAILKIKTGHIRHTDVKAKTKILRGILDEYLI